MFGLVSALDQRLVNVASECIAALEAGYQTLFGVKVSDSNSRSIGVVALIIYCRRLVSDDKPLITFALLLNYFQVTLSITSSTNAATHNDNTNDNDDPFIACLPTSINGEPVTSPTTSSSSSLSPPITELSTTSTNPATSSSSTSSSTSPLPTLLSTIVSRNSGRFLGTPKLLLQLVQYQHQAETEGEGVDIDYDLRPKTKVSYDALDSPTRRSSARRQKKQWGSSDPEGNNSTGKDASETSASSDAANSAEADVDTAMVSSGSSSSAPRPLFLHDVVADTWRQFAVLGDLVDNRVDDTSSSSSASTTQSSTSASSAVGSSKTGLATRIMRGLTTTRSTTWQKLSSRRISVLDREMKWVTLTTRSNIACCSTLT